MTAPEPLHHEDRPNRRGSIAMAPEKEGSPYASLDDLTSQLSWQTLQQTCFQELKASARVMIVDDDPITIMLVRECLSHEGYGSIITTVEATKAVETISHEEPDVLLLDVMMPGISGLTILERIRGDERFMDLPVIILTASTDQATKQHALDLGATEFLTKPVDPTEVLPRVRNALVVKAHQDHLKDYARELEREVFRQIRKVKDYAAAVEKTNEELRRSQSAAQAANRAKSQFLANMSHEIRTPLTAMIGFAEVVLDDSESELLANQDIASLDSIVRNGRHLLSVINDILDLSKIEAGQLEIEVISCSTCQIVTEVVQNTRIEADKKGVSLQVEWATPIPERIRTDPTCLRQILINLVGNAVKFTSQGSVRVVVSLLDEGDEEARLQFDVVDTGIGISRAKLDSLFQPFVQADVTCRRKFGGTGLGLTISKRLTEKLGGSIGVESELGRGSTFRVAIPTGPLDGVAMMQDPCVPAARERKNTGPACVPARSKFHDLDCRILLAEDSVDCQRLIILILRKAGAEVVAVDDGQAAFDVATESLARGEPFDVILMDMQMPILDGYAATRKLREADYPFPIIALTAHAMSCERERCLLAGCDDYATKPIDREALLGMVIQYVNRRADAPSAPRG